jgi:FkbH-like protein
MYGRTLLSLNDFETPTLTQEDMKRGQMYAQERRRRKTAEVKMDLKEFMKSLDLKVLIKLADNFTIPRISQLTQRTNQFNLTTRRYNIEDINRLITTQKAHVYSLNATDRFGDYGLVGVAIILPEDGKWQLDTYLLSCRILGRNIEKAFLAYIAKEAAKKNVGRIIGSFIPSAKNKPAEQFFHTMFSQVIKEEDGTYQGQIDARALAASWPEEIQLVE